ncbi:hypothetical protein VVD49_09630 [Uliginosibacterium sp. H3]|uniref:Uncharacterized protein n=1 Tax=Uliginosibacterium silvisoli TaxID=3114758 RepID=A0ABU6K416_9RHOO|nr:hypothetical protein [Uliginosibacterium sp. H3]
MLDWIGESVFQIVCNPLLAKDSACQQLNAILINMLYDPSAFQCSAYEPNKVHDWIQFIKPLYAIWCSHESGVLQRGADPAASRRKTDASQCCKLAHASSRRDVWRDGQAGEERRK